MTLVWAGGNVVSFSGVAGLCGREATMVVTVLHGSVQKMWSD